MKKGKKVFVGLSGGVDSSVSLALLKKAGYDATGVFIKSWHPDWLPCDFKNDRRDAMRVCALLDVPFATLDLEKEYKKEVVDYMIAEYKKGRTPNPDVMCNKEIKFGAFLKYAQKHGADLVATGHYAQQKIKNNVRQLAASKDRQKDQTYFLWTLTQKQLECSLFPIGHLKKPQVRLLAKQFNLPTAEKKDSQGLCFIGKVDMKNFLSHFIKTRKGSVLNTEGKIIGTHDGTVFLTIGQRHGFTVKNKNDIAGPMYIVNKDNKKNTITVSRLTPREVSKVGVKEITLSHVNWSGVTPISGKKYSIQARYRQTPEMAVLKKTNGNLWKVVFEKNLIGISPGQSLVVYKKNLCIGGGIIESSL